LQEDDCAGPALSPSAPPLLSIICCNSLLLRYLGTLDLISFGSSLGSWRFCLMGFVWGLCWASIRLRFGGFPYRWSRLIAGSEHNKQRTENTQKELQGKGRFSFLGHQGRTMAASHYYSLAVQASSKIDEQTRKKTRRFSGRIFWAIHFPHPIASNVCPSSFLFFFPRSFALCPPRLVHSECGHLV